MDNVASGGQEPRRSGGAVPIPRSKRGIKGFFSEVGREMKKVSWPTRAETNRLTGVVLGVCLLVVTLLTTMSFVFDTAIKLITKGSI